MRIWIAVFALAALAVGCSGNDTGGSGSTSGSTGSSSGTSGSTGSTGGGCTMTLSGAISQTVNCTVNGGFSSSDNKGSVAINGLQTQFVVGMSADGHLSAQTYDGNNAEISASATENGGQSTWFAGTADGAGSGSFVLTSVTTSSQVGSDAVYTLHGTATATLIPAPTNSASQNVTIDVTF